MTVADLMTVHKESIVLLAAERNFSVPREAGSGETISSLTLSKNHIQLEEVVSADVTDNVAEPEYQNALHNFSFGGQTT